MSELTVRTPSEADAAAVSQLVNAITQDLYGEGDADEDEVRTGWFAIPGLEMFLAERDGVVVGYADVRRDAVGARFPIDIRVHPDARGEGIAEALLDRAMLWSREHAQPGDVARGFAPERDLAVRHALERDGFRLIRHSFHMLIEPLDDLPKPEWPDGISVRTYDPDRDLEALYECTEEAFEDHWDYRRIPLDEWKHFNLHREDFDPSLWWLAEDDGELAAVCLNAWHFSGDRTFGWVGTLGVRRPWRRRGLALALLRQSFLDFRQRGATRVGLGVDAENTTGAVRLYERAGMRPVRRNDQYEKELV